MTAIEPHKQQESFTVHFKLNHIWWDKGFVRVLYISKAHSNVLVIAYEYAHANYPSELLMSTKHFCIFLPVLLQTVALSASS